MTEYSPEKVDQQDAMAKRLRSKKIDGYSFSLDPNSDAWTWDGPKGYFYATPWDTLMAHSMGSSAGNPNIVKVEAYDNDNEEKLADELSDVLFVLICLANQTGIDLEKSFHENLNKKTNRDKNRHKSNPKLK